MFRPRHASRSKISHVAKMSVNPSVRPVPPPTAESAGRETGFPTFGSWSPVTVGPSSASSRTLSAPRSPTMSGKPPIDSPAGQQSAVLVPLLSVRSSRCGTTQARPQRDRSRSGSASWIRSFGISPARTAHVYRTRTFGRLLIPRVYTPGSNCRRFRLTRSAASPFSAVTVMRECRVGHDGKRRVTWRRNR